MPTPFLCRKIAGIATALLVLAGTAARGTLTDANFSDAQFVTNNTSLNQMTGIGWAPDGSNRLFVIRKTGQVMIIQNGTILATPFATLSPVYTNSECGLVGFTFDPGFASNGHIYFFITVSNSEQRILRYTAVGNTGTAATTIMSGLPTAGQNHDGGGIGIGPDGKLYWSIGDLGNGTGVDGNLTSLAAKVGRANRDGSVPQGNPFSDGAGPNNDYIWARGVRNPFTMTFQPGSGKLWLNVVGTSYEQVFVITKGSHAGYNDYENNQPTDYLTPVIKYRTNGTDNRTISAVRWRIPQLERGHLHHHRHPQVPQGRENHDFRGVRHVVQRCVFCRVRPQCHDLHCGAGRTQRQQRGRQRRHPEPGRLPFRRSILGQHRGSARLSGEFFLRRLQQRPHDARHPQRLR